jgi:hypothetical protein
MSYSFDFWLQMKIIGRLSLEKKRELVCILNGMPDSQALSRWMRKDKLIVLKPQYFHSAICIFVLYKFPDLRSKPSFYDKIAFHGVEKEACQLAMDVLNADDDGRCFLKDEWKELSGKCVMLDDHNQKIISRTQDGNVTRKDMEHSQSKEANGLGREECIKTDKDIE